MVIRSSVLLPSQCILITPLYSTQECAVVIGWPELPVQELLLPVVGWSRLPEELLLLVLSVMSTCQAAKLCSFYC